jgi:hypothetical protein
MVILVEKEEKPSYVSKGFLLSLLRKERGAYWMAGALVASSENRQNHGPPIVHDLISKPVNTPLIWQKECYGCG